jgi:glycosyltransferase domain-containing protein
MSILNTIQSQLTIIIITNRAFPIVRAAEYYSTWGCKVIICDSSEEVNTINKYNSIEHIHYPNDLFFTKITKVLKLVQTPYVCLSADDDFLSPNGVLTGIEFLNKNHDYVSVQGIYTSFKLDTKDKNIDTGLCYEWLKELHINNEEAFDRVVASANTGMHQLYSLHRIEILKKIYSICGDINNSAYVEYNSNLIGMFYGKHKMLPVFWMARDSYQYATTYYHPQDGSNFLLYLAGLKSFLENHELGLNYKGEFSKLFSEVTGNSFSKGEELFKKVYFDIYFHNNNLDNSEVKLLFLSIKNNIKIFLKRVIPNRILDLLQKNKSEIHPIMYDSIYNSEWKEIKKLILKYNKS